MKYLKILILAALLSVGTLSCSDEGGMMPLGLGGPEASPEDIAEKAMELLAEEAPEVAVPVEEPEGSDLSDFENLANNPEPEENDDETGDDSSSGDTEGDDSSGDDVAGDDSSGDDVAGDDSSGDDVAGDDSSGDDCSW